MPEDIHDGLNEVAKAAAWNAVHPTGTPVTYWVHENQRARYGTTQGPARVARLYATLAVVPVAGMDIGIDWVRHTDDPCQHPRDHRCIDCATDEELTAALLGPEDGDHA